MSDETKNVTFDDGLSIVSTFAGRAQRGGKGSVAPEITAFVDAVPNGQILLQQFAETYADFRRTDAPGAETQAADYMSGFIGDHVAVAREINVSAVNAGKGTLGQLAMNAVSAHIDATLTSTPKTPAPTVPQARRTGGLTA